jgi:hypothetical protein
MRWSILAIAALASSHVCADEPPLVQGFLHSGQLARGEQALSRALAEKPDDDQARFGLAVVQLVQGIERLGQSLHFYGVKPSNDLFLRLPVPENPDPAPINAYRFRKMLDDFRRDLIAVEATLAGIEDDEVQLPLKLAEITLDFDADGEPTDKFRDVLLKLFNNRRFQFMEGNPEFLVVFDRGDVAWLRAYCHLMAGIIDLVLAVDTEDRFDLWADRAFARPQIKFEGTDEERLKKTIDQRDLVLIEPARWGRFRKHLVAVTDLNDETWKHIRLETDDDHEWLPNSRQKGVLGLPVQDVQIDAWLVAMREFKRLLEGERTFPNFWDNKPDGLELDLKILLDDPPERIVGDGAFPRNLGDNYLVERRQLKVEVFFPVLGMFLNPATMGYPVWFN